MAFLTHQPLRLFTLFSLFSLFSLVAPVSLVETFHDLLVTEKGRVVNVGSVAGELTTAGGGAYSGSKHALRAATDAMRQEYHTAGVSVSLVAPGYDE